MPASNNDTITIDLSERNTVKRYPVEQLFQKEAYETVDRYFEEQSELFDKCRNMDTISKITSCRSHNTILITGPRGSGKTVFLYNLGERKNSSSEKVQEIYKNFVFLDLVDPTLLNGTADMESSESFIAVIVGLINNWAEERLRDASRDDDKKAYYNALKNVADSLNAMKSSSKEYGIDEIYASQSALSLEQNLHRLYQKASVLAGGKILVIRIDDIDMAFAHGFQVLEAIRKYLASPYILPVISGDNELYKHLIEKDFSEAMKSPMFPLEHKYVEGRARIRNSITVLIL